MSDDTTQPDSPERSEWLRLLRESPVPALVCDFPRRDLGGIPISQCRVEVLCHREVDNIRAVEAERMMERGRTPEALGGPAWEALYSDAVARALLARAVTGVHVIEGSATFPRLFLSGDEIAECLTPAESQRLLDLYNIAQRSSLADLTPEEEPTDHGNASE